MDRVVDGYVLIRVRAIVSLRICASRGFREAFPDGRAFSPSPAESAIPALPSLGGAHVARGEAVAGGLVAVRTWSVRRFVYVGRACALENRGGSILIIKE